MFYLREGESAVIKNHFNLLAISRIQLKKALKQFGNAPEKLEYAPKISYTSNKLAIIKRAKIGIDEGAGIEYKLLQ